LDDTSFSTANYDKLLIAWSNLQNLNTMHLGVGSTKYSPTSASARQRLINQFGWVITDGGITQAHTPFANMSNVTSVVQVGDKWFGISGKSVLQDDGTNITTVFTSPFEIKSDLKTTIPNKVYFLSRSSRTTSLFGKVIDLISLDTSTYKTQVVIGGKLSANNGVQAAILNATMKNFMFVSKTYRISRTASTTKYYKIDSNGKLIFLFANYDYTITTDQLHNTLHFKLSWYTYTDPHHADKKITDKIDIGLEDE